MLSVCLSMQSILSLIVKVNHLCLSELFDCFDWVLFAVDCRVRTLIQAPIYLSYLFHLYTPSRQLRSFADTRVFKIPSFHTRSGGQRSLSSNYLEASPCSCPPCYSCQFFEIFLENIYLLSFLQFHCPEIRGVCVCVC